MELEPLSDEELYKVKKETLIILRNRGFEINEDEQLILNDEITIEEFKLLYMDIKNDTTHPLYSVISKKIPFRTFMSNVYYNNNTKKRCLVFFAEPENKKTKKISNEQIAEFCKSVIETRVEQAIIVSNLSSSTSANSLCLDSSKGVSGIFIQYFTDEELLYNPLEHVYVPKHRIMSDSEIKELTEVDKISLKLLPKISFFDPVCKRLGADEGDVIEVLRTVLISDTLLDEELAYRVVFKPRLDKPKK
jgi:DNA-directed RNA polymerase subunit H (RpoH/RPB5)